MSSVSPESVLVLCFVVYFLFSFFFSFTEGQPTQNVTFVLGGQRSDLTSLCICWARPRGCRLSPCDPRTAPLTLSPGWYLLSPGHTHSIAGSLRVPLPFRGPSKV